MPEGGVPGGARGRCARERGVPEEAGVPERGSM